MAKPGPKKITEQIAHLAEELGPDHAQAARYVCQYANGRIAFSAAQVAHMARVDNNVATEVVELVAELGWCYPTTDTASTGGWLWMGQLGKGRV